MTSQEKINGVNQQGIMVYLFIIIIVQTAKLSMLYKLETSSRRDGNVQILVISKKLVNKLHSVGFITLLWLGITQWITNEISNFVICSNNIM